MNQFPWQLGQRIRQRWEVCRLPAVDRPVGICFDHLGGRPVVFRVLGDRPETWEQAQTLGLWVDMPLHAHLCRALNYERMDGLTILKTDYCPGGNLRAWCRRPAADTAELAHRMVWLLSISQAMDHLARHGIPVHGRLHPGNVLLTADRQVKLTDPALPISASAPIACRSFSNSPDAVDDALFAAPELTGSDTPPSIAADLYAFGVLAVLLLAGKTFPDSRTLAEPGALRQMISDPDTELPGNQLWQQCISVWPGERPESFAVLQPRLIAIHEQLAGSRPPALVRGDRLTARQWFELGQGLVDLERWTEAHPCFEQACSLEPEQVTYLYQQAKALNHDRRYDAAASVLEQILELDPDHQSARCELANLLLRRPLHRDRAIQLLQVADQAGYRPAGEALKRWSHDPLDRGVPFKAEDGQEEVLKRARAYLEAGKGDPALTCFDRVLALDALDLRGWIGKAQALHLLGNAQEALLCLNMAHSLQPASAEAFARKAVIHHDLGEHMEALRCFEQALRLGDRTILKQINLPRILTEENTAANPSQAAQPIPTQA